MELCASTQCVARLLQRGTEDVSAELEGFVDDTTAFMEGRNKELGGVPREGLGVDKKGGGEVVADVKQVLHAIWERSFRNAARKEGVELATRVETQVVDLRTRQPKTKEMARRKSAMGGFRLSGKKWCSRTHED